MEDKKRYNIALVSMGCDKNRIDSEIMLGILKGKHRIVYDAAFADIIIVNTCGFIDDAKEESINSILEMSRYKEEGNLKLLMATGCLTQRYGEELKKEIPELDVVLGVNSYGNLSKYIEEFMEKGEKIMDIDFSNENINEGERLLTTSFGASAYLRIGEGCSKHCTYCIIPKIRGEYRSRKMEDILKEAELLMKEGVKEIIVIAQDTTMYGVDLYKEQRLHLLLRELKKMDFTWVRVMYMYPETIYDELIDIMAEGGNILPYFDMPIQHISDSILKRMGRRTNGDTIRGKIEEIRKKIPHAVIRTTFIVGFPGESEEEFQEILGFLKKYKLQKVGAFTYSREENTPASVMENQIDDEVKEKRKEEMMLLQQDISREINENKIGNIYEVLMESFDGENYTGRNWEMAPEIDGDVLIKSRKPVILGDLIKVKITSATDYDIKGEQVKNEPSK